MFDIDGKKLLDTLPNTLDDWRDYYEIQQALSWFFKVGASVAELRCFVSHHMLLRSTIHVIGEDSIDTLSTLIRTRVLMLPT